MPTSPEEFFDEYSAALRAGIASIFVGAGLSMSAGLPSWDALLRPLRAAADVPDTVSDPTVVAEHLSHFYGPAVFEDRLLDRFRGPMVPASVHGQLSRLPFRNIWTTNYDTLLEDSHPSRFVIASDSAYARAKQAPRPTRIVKLHGSLSVDENGLLAWRTRPVITRTHFETYASEHPLFWADLTANFLTSTFLFVGFSFEDPNVEFLLRLSRTIRPEIRRSPHYAIMRRPPVASGREKVRGHELRVADLERAGIHVVEIADHAEIEEILANLYRLVQPQSVFVAGSRLSDLGSSFLRELAAKLATRYRGWGMVSLGGPASYEFASGMKRGMGERYDAERIRFYYRARDDDGGFVPRPNERVGTAVYSQEKRATLLPRVLRSSRAVLVVGGGDQTAEEVRIAGAMGLPVVPIALDGGTAGEWWSEHPDETPEEDTLDGWMRFAEARLAAALLLKDLDGEV